ncbi:MAG: acyltransferase family protein [Lachnospiraceae bacterium]|nr:acyltransferase family protein [Lachnospiraceae bacterium]
MKKRIEWVDIGKYICIMLVMISHLESDTVILQKIYHPVYLSFFFFLAGYVHKQPRSFGEHFIKKLRGLFIPWLIFSNLNIALSAVISLKENRNIAGEFLWNLLQIRGQYDGIWFVAALFVTFIPFYFVIKLDKKKALILTTALVVTAELYAAFMPKNVFPWNNYTLPWHLEYIPYALLWMVLGYYFKENAEKELDRKNTVVTRLVAVMIYLAIVYLLPDLKDVRIVHVLIEYGRTAAGIVMLILLCKVARSNRYIDYVGANTIIYFALHGKLYAVLEHVLSAKLSSLYSACLSNIWLSTLLAVVIATVMSFILIIPAYLINRFFPWIIGRKRQISRDDKTV